MFDNILLYFLSGLAGACIIGLYVAVINIVIMAMKPQKKYQLTSSFDPAFQTWFGSIFVMICISVIISLKTIQSTSSKYMIMCITCLIFIGIGLMTSASRRTIHQNDPEVKLSPITTIINITAACIPLIVSIFASLGISNVIGNPNDVFTTIVLFFILAIPSAIGSSLIMLFSRSASQPSYVYGTIISMCILILGSFNLVSI